LFKLKSVQIKFVQNLNCSEFSIFRNFKKERKTKKNRERKKKINRKTEKMLKTGGKTDSKIPQKRKRNEKPVKPAMKTKLTGQKVLETS
jgi:hypothetical protein